MTDQDNPGKAQDKRARNNRWLFRAMVVAVAAIAVANLLLGKTTAITTTAARLASACRSATPESRAACGTRALPSFLAAKLAENRRLQTIDQNRHPSRQPNQHDAAANIVAVTRQAWACARPGLIPPRPLPLRRLGPAGGAGRPAGTASTLRTTGAQRGGRLSGCACRLSSGAASRSSSP